MGLKVQNYSNAQQGQFQYKWSLYSAGHADLDVNKFAQRRYGA